MFLGYDGADMAAPASRPCYCPSVEWVLEAFNSRRKGHKRSLNPDHKCTARRRAQSRPREETQGRTSRTMASSSSTMTGPLPTFPPLAALFLTYFDDLKGQTIAYFSAIDSELKFESHEVSLSRCG